MYFQYLELPLAIPNFWVLRITKFAVIFVITSNTVNYECRNISISNGCNSSDNDYQITIKIHKRRHYYSRPLSLKLAIFSQRMVGLLLQRHGDDLPPHNDEEMSDGRLMPLITVLLPSLHASFHYSADMRLSRWRDG